MEGITHNSLSLNGSTSSEEILSTSIMYSPTSIPSQKRTENPFLSERTLNCSMVPQPLPKQSKCMATGLLLGRHSLMLPYLFSNIGNSSFSCMEGTSNNSLSPYLPNSIPASSTMIEQSK
ncbi:hypothetical protein L208DRAFT_1559368, partial [Tricholoma matsutake]